MFSSARSGSHNITIAKISTNGILMLRLCVLIIELEVALWQRGFKIPLAMKYVKKGHFGSSQFGKFIFQEFEKDQSNTIFAAVWSFYIPDGGVYRIEKIG